jgi:hypothetical protein
MTNQLEATLGVLKDVSADAVGSVHHGFEVLGEQVSDTVGHVFGQDPPPSHKGRWAGVALCVGAVILVMVILRRRRTAPVNTQAEGRDG